LLPVAEIEVPEVVVKEAAPVPVEQEAMDVQVEEEDTEHAVEPAVAEAEATWFTELGAPERSPPPPPCSTLRTTQPSTNQSKIQEKEQDEYTFVSEEAPSVVPGRIIPSTVVGEQGSANTCLDAVHNEPSFAGREARCEGRINYRGNASSRTAASSPSQ
jgi:hypothetical protein